MSTQLVNAVFSSSGKKINIEFVPWPRALKMLHNLESGGSYPWAKNKEREKDLLYSKPIHVDSVRFFGKQELLDNKTENWYKKRLCVPASWEIMGLESFIKKYEIEVERPVSMENCFRMVEYGRIDLVFVNELVGNRTLKKLYDGKTTIGPVGHYHKTGHSYFVISKKYPGAKEIIKNFNEGLEKITKSGVYQSIVNQALLDLK